MINIETLTVATIVVAVVGALKDLLPGINSNVTRVVAIGVGALLGYLHLGASDPLSGALAGLVAVGVTTVADRVNK